MRGERDDLPPTIVEPDGTVLTRDIRPFTVRYKGESLTVELPGYYPDGEGESVHVGIDMEATDRALAVLKAQLGEIDPTDLDSAHRRKAS